MPKKIIKRSFALQNVELRAAAEGEAGRTLVGYAAVFDQPAEIWPGFIEIIRKGAFRKTLKESDVRALFNHDDNFVLGRTKAKTLRLQEDDHGLRVEIDIPDTQWARDLAVSIERGDIDQMSFAFSTVREKVTKGENGSSTSEKLEVRLYDVSPVTYPAYSSTEVSVREARARGYELDDEPESTPDDESGADSRTAPPLAGHPDLQLMKMRQLHAERI